MLTVVKCCAWCECCLIDGWWRRVDTTKIAVTHGICPRCFKREMRALRRREIAATRTLTSSTTRNRASGKNISQNA